MPKTIALVGALDTKGAEYGFVKQCIEARGNRTLVIDVGVLGQPRIPADVPREAVARAAGVALADLVAKQDRGAQAKLLPEGFEPIGSAPSELTAFMKAGIAKYGKIVKDAKITVE